jgi:hypothetical protein
MQNLTLILESQSPQFPTLYSFPTFRLGGFPFLVCEGFVESTLR